MHTYVHFTAVNMLQLFSSNIRLYKNVRLIAVRREYVQNHYTISSQSFVGFLRFGVPGVTCECLLSDTKKICITWLESVYH